MRPGATQKRGSSRHASLLFEFAARGTYVEECCLSKFLRREWKLNGGKNEKWVNFHYRWNMKGLFL